MPHQQWNVCKYVLEYVNSALLSVIKHIFYKKKVYQNKHKYTKFVRNKQSIIYLIMRKRYSKFKSI